MNADKTREILELVEDMRNAVAAAERVSKRIKSLLLESQAEGTIRLPLS